MLTEELDMEPRDCRSLFMFPRRDHHLPPEAEAEAEAKSIYSLGIDLGSSKIRFGIFSRDNPKSAFDNVTVIENVLSVDLDGKLVAGPPPSPEFKRLPSTWKLFARKFENPEIGDADYEHPMPLFEHRESANYVIPIGEGKNRIEVTPEGTIAALFDAVKESALRRVGEHVVDASIAVPAMFTSVQREAVRDAAECAGLRVAHIASAALVAARAMKSKGELPKPGLVVIVDAGASKTDVSLMYNASEGIREVNTVGSDAISGDAIRDQLVSLCLPKVRSAGDVVNPHLQDTFRFAVTAALSNPDDRRIVIPDVGNGEMFDELLTDRDISLACEPIVFQIGRLIDEVFTNQDQRRNIVCVGCIGGATMLKPLQDAVVSAFPGINVRQLDANAIVAAGATLDSAQVTGRLPLYMQTVVQAIAPYSISIQILGKVLISVIQRGEMLPAVGETVTVTTVDDQSCMELEIYQGEHYLAELCDLIGTTHFKGLQQLPRGQCQVKCRIEYDMNGILQFSAKEVQTRASISAVFTANSDFTDADHARLRHRSQESRVEEVRAANVRHLRELLRLDIERAELQHLTQAAQRWRQWLDDHQDGEVHMFAEKQYEALVEFSGLNPDGWEKPRRRPDGRFTLIWPNCPSFSDEGMAIIRFLTPADCRHVVAQIEDVDTKNVTSDFDICQLTAGRNIETVMRVYFPANGRYHVTMFAGSDNTAIQPVGELVYTSQALRFDVRGAPAARRRLCQLLAHRKFVPMVCPDNFLVTPPDSYVKLPGNEYKFTCTSQGGQLVVNGRKPEGEKEPVFFPTMVERRIGSQLCHDCTLTCPGPGVWHVMFFVGDNFVGVQTVIAGNCCLTPTAEESAALNAPIPPVVFTG
jgi:molecular chaperone DnaK (HSP70)